MEAIALASLAGNDKLGAGAPHHHLRNMEQWIGQPVLIAKALDV
jgi:hypothetical protein